jgi:predicted nucleotidyltransferase component of viral defense system
MSIEIIEQRLAQYQCKTSLDERNALKEITQEIALMALSKANFFKEAEFHGGTALRILYGLQRFSEDLDFALMKPSQAFSLNYYLERMADDFLAYGYKVEISDRTEVQKTVQKQFLKVDSLGKLIHLQYPLNKSERKIKVKFEIDTNPPLGAKTELKYLTFPLAFSILAKDLPSSFSGKLHALLCRSYVKGRDWYDFIWYLTNKSSINFILLKNALYQQGPWKGQSLTINKNWLIEHLAAKVQSIDWDEVKQDVLPLLRANEISSLDLWKKDFFLALVVRLQQDIED